jgi:hypothetical protein
MTLGSTNTNFYYKYFLLFAAPVAKPLSDGGFFALLKMI